MYMYMYTQVKLTHFAFYLEPSRERVTKVNNFLHIIVMVSVIRFFRRSCARAFISKSDHMTESWRITVKIVRREYRTIEQACHI